MFASQLDSEFELQERAPAPPSPVTEQQGSSGSWHMTLDEASQKLFYYNTETKETSWIAPPGCQSSAATNLATTNPTITPWELEHGDGHRNPLQGQLVEQADLSS